MVVDAVLATVALQREVRRRTLRCGCANPLDQSAGRRSRRGAFRRTPEHAQQPHRRHRDGRQASTGSAEGCADADSYLASLREGRFSAAAMTNPRPTGVPMAVGLKCVHPGGEKRHSVTSMVGGLRVSTGIDEQTPTISPAGMTSGKLRSRP